MTERFLPLPPRALRVRGVWCVGVLLLLTASPASASALGSLATSLGMVAALAAWVVVKSLPSTDWAFGLPALAGLAICGGVAAWRWRPRGLPWLAASARARMGAPPHAGSTASTVRDHSRRDPVELPAGMCRETLLDDLRQHYLRVQAAWDQREHRLLSELTTPEMLDELQAERDQCLAQVSPCRTEIVVLRAELLAVDRVASSWVASVQFSGLLRESAERDSISFREVWILVRDPAASAGWRLARHQALW